ncbi:MAG: hypothetical protein AABZ39_18435 [Spirochaetota bacterium]
MRRLILLFIDGIGIGTDDPAINPLIADTPLFGKLMGGIRLAGIRRKKRFPGGILVPVDANLGVAGLPQSATGQTTIFTGVNAAKFIGRHLNAFPSKRLVNIINERSIMKVLKEHGCTVTGANMYSKDFFIKRKHPTRNLFPVSTLTILASGEQCRDVSDYPRTPAVFMDITNAIMRERGYAIPLVSPETAAENLLCISRDSDFTFFEYFLTDIFGHKKNAPMIRKSVDELNSFAGSVVAGMDDSTSLLVISDHGNAEDMTVRTHTRARVPLILFSKDTNAVSIFSRVTSLVGVYAAVMKYFDIEKGAIHG